MAKRYVNGLEPLIAGLGLKPAGDEGIEQVAQVVGCEGDGASEGRERGGELAQGEGNGHHAPALDHPMLENDEEVDGGIGVDPGSQEEAIDGKSQCIGIRADRLARGTLAGPVGPS